MKIGLDARMYGPKQGGLGRYIEQLVLHLEKLPTNAEFVIFLRRDNWNEYTPSAPNFRKVLADIPWYGFAEQTHLPGIIKKAKVRRAKLYYLRNLTGKKARLKTKRDFEAAAIATPAEETKENAE